MSTFVKKSGDAEGEGDVLSAAQAGTKDGWEPGLPHSHVLGVRFVAAPFASVIDSVSQLLAGDARNAEYLCATGVHGVIEARRDPHLRRVLNGAAYNVADGMPAVIVNRLTGHRSAERAFGPDVMWAIVQSGVPLHVRHFLYGGKEGVAVRLGETLRERIPGANVVGSYCPPFRPLTEQEKEDVASRVNESGADVLWVGLSTPKQERWIAEMRPRLRVKLIASVGAAFDYHTGALRPAPSWMKRSALEWLFRLRQEPKRLWRRYAVIVPTFLFLILLQLTGLRRFPTE